MECFRGPDLVYYRERSQGDDRHGHHGYRQAGSASSALN